MIVLEIKSKKYGIKNVFIDGEDFDKISGYTWCINYNKNSKTFYALTHIKTNSIPRQKTLLMHRLILNCDSDKVADHRDHDGLNNTRSNLRECTKLENSRNRNKQSNGVTSKYKGVCLHKKTGKFMAQIPFNKKKIYLGLFDSEEEGAIAYNEASLKYYGEFANLNIMEG